MADPSREPSLISASRELPNLAKSPIGKAAIWAVITAFVSVVVGGWSFGHHLQAVGLVFAVLAGLSLLALFGIGLAAAVMFVSRPGRPQPGPGPDSQPYRGQHGTQRPDEPQS